MNYLPNVELTGLNCCTGSETGARTALGSTRMPRSSEVDDELASMRGTSDVSTSGFERLEHQRQQEKKKQQPSVSFRGHVAGGDVGMAIKRTKRKMDVGLLARGRAGKAKGEERKAAGMKPAASSEVQLGELDGSQTLSVVVIIWVTCHRAFDNHDSIFKRTHTTSINTIIWQFVPFIYHPL